jgi:hypothetical protein
VGTFIQCGARESVTSVWGADLAAFLNHSGAGAGANFLGLVNGLGHLLGYLESGVVYNPGFLTLFLPVAFLGFRALLRESV